MTNSHTAMTGESRAIQFNAIAIEAAADAAATTTEATTGQAAPDAPYTGPTLTSEDLKKIAATALDDGGAAAVERFINDIEVQQITEYRALRAASRKTATPVASSPGRDRGKEIWLKSKTVAESDVPFWVPFLIDDWLVSGQVSMLWGPSNTGKTNLMMSAVEAITEGKPWAGFETTLGSVVVIAAESPSSVLRRAKLLSAAAQKRILVYDEPINLVGSTLDAEGMTFVAKGFERKSGHKVELIVVDTLVLCLGDGDENSTGDATRAIKSAKYLASQTGAHVMLVHHTGKDASAGARGSSALYSNVDTAVGLLPKTSNGFSFVEAELVKQRDAEKGARVRFRIDSIVVGTDPRGRKITMPKVAFLLDTDFVESGPPGEAKSVEDSGLVLRALADLERASSDPGNGFTAREVADKVGPVFKPASQPDSRRKAVKKVLDEAGAMSPPIVVAAGNRYRTIPASTPGAALTASI